MEQIIVTHLDNTTLLLQSKANVSKITKAEQVVDLLGQDVVNISVESARKLDFYLGDKITIIGRDYTLNTPPNEKKISESHFTYDLQFEGVQYDMIRAAFSVNVDTTSKEIQDLNGDSLTGDMKMFLDVLVANLNRVFPNKWVIGNYPLISETRTESFSDTDNCLSVLQSLCGEDKYNMEYFIDIAENGVRTINVHEVGSVFPFTFKYGKGKGIYELTRQKISSSNIVTRLYAYGGSKNINTTKYRANKLCLPLKSKGESYIENSAAIAKYGIWESTKNFDDIYPHRTGSVSALGSNNFKFVDSSMDFDLNEKDNNGNTKYLISGSAAKVHFNTGNLAGYEFEITKYDHSTKTFEIIQQTDENGYKFPSDTSAAFQFAVGNEYVLVGIYQPDSYVETAEANLNAKAEEYLTKYSQPLVSYGLTVDSFFLKSIVGAEANSNLIWVGDYIPVSDSDLNLDKTLRVKGFTRDLTKDYQYTISIADLPITVTTVSKVISELNQIDKVIKFNNLNDPAKARRNYKATSELVTMIDTVQAEAALIGNNPAAQFDLSGVAVRANYNKDANSINLSSGTINHNYYPVGDPGSWSITAGTFTSLTSATAYYVYIKASKSEATAIYYLSSTKIGVEDVSGFYMFPLGVLSSVIDGARVFTSTKGYTLITGDSIRTGRISSNDGTRYFDLTTGEFKGDFKFTSGTSVETAIGTAQTNAINTSLEHGTGKNLLPQAEFANGLDDWGYGYTLPALNATGRGVNLNSDWALNGNTNLRNNQGLNTAFMVHGGWADEQGEYAYLSSQSIKGIQGGKKYIVSAYVGNHRADRVDIYVDFFNSNGSWLNYSGSDQPTCYCVFNEASGGQNINGYKRIYAVVTAHQDAVSANIVIRKFGTAEGYSDSYMFVCRPMLEQVAEQTTKPGAWSPYASGAEIAESKALLADIASDSKLTPNEKIQVKKEWLAMQEQFSVIDNQCTVLGLDDAGINDTYADFTNYYSYLNSYITPLLADMAATSDIIPADFNGYFTNCYAGFETQRAQINSTINTKAVNAQSTADNIQVGVSNLLQNSSYFALSANNTGLGTSVLRTDESDKYYRATPDSGNSVSLHGMAYTHISGNQYMTSMYVRQNSGSAKNIQIYQNANLAVSTKTTSVPSGVWTQIKTNPYTATGESSIILVCQTVDVAIDYKMAQIEYGNKVTDWKPSSVDVPKAVDYLAQALTGSTEISGGLVGTNVILLKSIAGIITGGMSGLSDDNVGMWTGGTYQQAIDSLAKVILRKDGSGQLAGGKILWDLYGALNVGNFKIEGGDIVGYADSKDKVRVSTGAIPSLSSLISGQTITAPDLYSITSEGQEHNSTDSTIIAYLDKVSYGSITVSANTPIVIHFPTIYSRLENAGNIDYEIIYYSIYRNGVLIGTYLSEQTINLSAGGTYNIELHYNLHIEIEAYSVCQYFISTNVNGYITYQLTPERSEIGKDGLYSYWSTLLYLYFSQSQGLKYRGAIDMPAGIGGGTVVSNGTTSGGWGKYTPTSSKSSATVTITHNIGDSNYTILIMPTNSITFYLANKGNSTIQVVMSSTGGTFDYILMRTT